MTKKNIFIINICMITEFYPSIILCSEPVFLVISETGGSKLNVLHKPEIFRSLKVHYSVPRILTRMSSALTGCLLSAS